MFDVEILADSIANGVRLTTVKMTFPRCILAELKTHRMIHSDEELSMNAASSRAVPYKRLREMVLNTPFIPDFRLNKGGMQAGDELREEEAFKANRNWTDARSSALMWCDELNELNIHKQYINRIIEPWMWCTVICSATDWENLFHQRCHEAAEPSFQTVSYMLRDKMKESIPIKLKEGMWHLPYVDEEANYNLSSLTLIEIIKYLEDLPEGKRPKGITNEWRKLIDIFAFQLISAGRCAKVSYLNLDTGVVDILNDIRLGLMLCMNTPGHFSPLEHQATPFGDNNWKDFKFSIDQLDYCDYEDQIFPKSGEVGYCGNFKGWKQFRKFFPNENYDKTN